MRYTTVLVLLLISFLIVNCSTDEKENNIQKLKVESNKLFEFYVGIHQDGSSFKIKDTISLNLKRAPFVIEFNTPIDYVEGVKAYSVFEGVNSPKIFKGLKISSIEALNDKNKCCYSTDKKLKLHVDYEFFHKGIKKHGHLPLSKDILENWSNTKRVKLEKPEYLNQWNVLYVFENNKKKDIEQISISNLTLLIVYDYNENKEFDEGEYKVIEISFN